MPHHVGIGIVHHDQIEPLADGPDQPVGHLGGTHLGLKVIGGDVGRRGHVAFFPRKRHFTAPVQKECHMRIFLGLGQPQLPQPLRRHPFADGVVDVGLGIGRRHVRIMRGRIIDHAQHRRPDRPAPGVKGDERRVTQRRQNLTRPVGAEVQAEQPVAIRHPGIAADHRGRDELIRFAPCRRQRHGGRGIGCHGALRMDHRRIGRRHPLPPVVAVHRPVPARHRRHPRAHRQAVDQVGDIARSR